MSRWSLIFANNEDERFVKTSLDPTKTHFPGRDCTEILKWNAMKWWFLDAEKEYYDEKFPTKSDRFDKQVFENVADKKGRQNSKLHSKMSPNVAHLFQLSENLLLCYLKPKRNIQTYPKTEFPGLLQKFLSVTDS